MLKPIEEGGIGLEPIADIMEALHAKLAWSYMNGKSIWAKLMIDKCGRFEDTIQSIRKVHCSHIWAFMFPLLKAMQLNSIKLFDPIFGEHKWFWKETETGLFTLKSWKERRRKKGNNWQFLWNTWHCLIPTKYSLMTWKAIMKGLPTDGNFTKIKVQLASRCRCCLAPDTKSMEHILIHSDVARSVWSLSNRLGVINQYRNTIHLAFTWVERGNEGSFFTFVRRLICVFCLSYMETSK